ncbi:MAG TPA: ankyrin repeat domain-containing protein [Spirochaetota bacterium]|nr:ankyrin repeat domain-containing protein [Spirochaetota bacterium]HOM37697.1 ankyrin repeat domain-containing protein [Spirochaetota bacterium]HPQ49655.1 ankyrin repeat domain-containing protein [Spirochaetota bacterium]
MKRVILLLILVSFLPFFSISGQNESNSDIFNLIRTDRDKAIGYIGNLNKTDILSIKDSKGRGIINHATSLNDISLVQLLLSKGIDINFKDDLGFTALHDAVISSNKDMVLFLLSKGANPNIGDNRGITPLMFAIKNGEEQIFRILLPVTNKYTKDLAEKNVLHYCVYYNRVDMLKVIINDYKLLINQKDNIGRTPLHYAASLGNIEIVKILLENGANPNILDYSNDYRRTALDYTTNEEVRKLITNYGGENGKYSYVNKVAFGPTFYTTDFDSPIYYYGGGFELYLDKSVSLYWTFAYGENSGYKNYKLGGIYFALHNIFTLFKTNYDKEYNEKNFLFKALLVLSAISPEGIYINFYVNDYPFIFYSIYAGFAGLDMASSPYDKDFYVSGAIGGRGGIIPIDDLRITLFFNLRLTYNTGNGGYEMGGGISYKF